MGQSGFVLSGAFLKRLNLVLFVRPVPVERLQEFSPFDHGRTNGRQTTDYFLSWEQGHAYLTLTIIGMR